MHREAISDIYFERNTTVNKVLSIPCVLTYYNASCMKYGTLYGTLCHAIYVNDIIYCIARNFRGRKLSQISLLCGYLQKFSTKFGGVASFGAAKASNPWTFSPLKSYFSTSSKVSCYMVFTVYCTRLKKGYDQLYKMAFATVWMSWVGSLKWSSKLTIRMLRYRSCLTPDWQ